MITSKYQIDERVIQRAMEPYPNFDQIVEFSTPVVSFGYPNDAKVATLGINPSSNEFQIGNGNKNPLPIGKKRLVDTEILGLEKPTELSRKDALKVISGCYSYFTDGNPYDWFDDLQQFVLDPLKLSFKEGSACHLDLVQWATDPVWQDKKMPKDVKKQLLMTDKEFLKYQLTNYAFKVVFLNGSTVLNQFNKLNLTSLTKVAEVPFNNKGTPSSISTGSLDDTTFVGWGINLGYGATFKEAKLALSGWLASNIEI